MIEERNLFAARLENIDVPKNLIKSIVKQGLGQKRKKRVVYSSASVSNAYVKQLEGPTVAAGNYLTVCIDSLNNSLIARWIWCLFDVFF